MALTNTKMAILMYLRHVSARKLWVACIAVHGAVFSLMWNCQLGPAVREIQAIQQELTSRRSHRGAVDTLRSQLTTLQEEVRTLRREFVKPDDGSDRLALQNRLYSFIETIAEDSGLRMRLFDTEGRGSIPLDGTRESKVVLEGAFADVVKFTEALAYAPSFFRLDHFVANASSELPATISLSLTLSDVRPEANAPSLCAPTF
jgi:hypothetical protein